MLIGKTGLLPPLDIQFNYLNVPHSWIAHPSLIHITHFLSGSSAQTCARMGNTVDNKWFLSSWRILRRLFPAPAGMVSEKSSEDKDLNKTQSLIWTGSSLKWKSSHINKQGDHNKMPVLRSVMLEWSEKDKWGSHDNNVFTGIMNRLKKIKE